MKKISESQYQMANGETGTLNINLLHVSHLASVVHNNLVLQPDPTGAYVFTITRSSGKIEFLIVTATFLSNDPQTAEYQLFLQDQSGTSFPDRVIKHTDPPITWQSTIRLVVV